MDPLLDITDGLVGLLADALDGEQFAVVWKDTPAADLSDAALGQKCQVWVVDFAETLTTEAHHGATVPIEDDQVLVTLQKVLNKSEPIPTQIRALSAAAAAVARLCRGRVVEMSDHEGALCYKVTRTQARDLKDNITEGRYYAEILTHWKRISPDE